MTDDPSGQGWPAPPPATSHAQDDWLTRLLVPVDQTRSWLKFLGAVLIVVGAIQALTIVGIIVAWVYIWLGVLLWQAGDRAGLASQMQDPEMLEQYLSKLKTVIMIGGVLAAVALVMGVVSVILVFTFGWLATLMEMFPT